MATVYPYSQWQFCPVCGHPLSHPSVEGNPQVTCSSCDFISYDAPWPGTVVLLENERGEVLLLRRAIAPHVGEWDTPGGFLNADETLEEGAGREVLEETGLVARDLRVIAGFPSRYGPEGHPTLGAVLVGRVEGEPVLQDGENSEWAWFSANNLPPTPFQDVRTALRRWAEARGVSAGR